MHTAYISFHPLLPPSLEPQISKVPLLRWPLALALLFPPHGLRWDIVTFNSLAAIMPWHQVFTTLQAILKPWEDVGFGRENKYGMKLGFLQQEFHPSIL